MGGFCTNCGKKINRSELFCTGCGEKLAENQTPVIKAEEAPFHSEAGIPSTHRNNKKGFKFVIFSLLGIVIVFIAAYFMMNNLKAHNQKATQADSIKKANESKSASNNKETTAINQEDIDQSTDEEGGTEIKQKEVVGTSEQSIINYYNAKLNNLRIFTSGREISVGEWTVSRQDEGIVLSASEIPSRELARIFGLYDDRNLLPLKTWAKEVFDIAQTLSKELDAEWLISVGNNCVGEYPVTLPQSDLINYSGSCGYSIPVLGGTTKDNLTLVMHTSVFGMSNSNPPSDFSSEYIFPESDYVRLTMSELELLTPNELRLARNEIYARHGYIFESDDLRIYFSKKSWYIPNPNYDGSLLNSIEKYNVKLIQDREKDVQ
ncbi:YARHG domain-containing protein [Neobacillus sp. SuZ13]|uniref:YARHG domain-containing protein n=1 Tax=Neobacillus sp. SuZ13 TaxID=3047875 RepID=UPI0024BF501B|nr:YARHG domain-containing protein [Neobacillus sp. SuZ13]WHY64740.1 YARHG domain-containing protein [Neobacillus sp. SuZ13]